MEFLTLMEVAERWELSVDDLLAGIQSQRLVALYSSQWLLEAEQVERWIEEGSPTEPIPDPGDPVGSEYERLTRELPGSMIVYVLQRGEDGPLKIGFVKRIGNLARRIQDIQHGCAERVHVRRLIPTEPEEFLEIRLHALFGEHRLMGEWFEPSPRLLGFANDWAQAQPMKGE